MSSGSQERDQGGVPVAHPPRITDPEIPIRTLHKGFDGFDVAIKGCLKSEDLKVLEIARLTAERENREPLVEIGPGKVSMFVASSGAKGGYRYRCDTGPFGAILFIKNATSTWDWNIRISMKSLPLASWGILQVWEEIQEMLKNLGVEWIEESISRIDYAVDFLMPQSFSLNTEQFVAHARTINSEISTIPKIKDQFEREVQIHLSGRVPSSVTLGKMPGRQIIIYNKRKEAIARQKYYWFDLWGVDSEDDDISVWRIEIRGGKKHLNSYKIKTFTDLTNQFGDLVHAALNAMRYVRADPSDTNITRSSLHPLWGAVKAETASALFEFRAGIIPDNIIEGLQERIRDNYRAQIVALLPGALISSGYSVNDGLGKIAEYLSTVEKLAKNHPDRFKEKLRLARERLHFTGRRVHSEN
jgi:hypothetical protein